MGIKYKVDSNFFKTWTPSMAYILGFITADGSLENAAYLRGKYLRICSSDIENFGEDKVGPEIRA
jgi:hypothetical protein